MRRRYRTPLEERFPPELRVTLGGEEIVYEKSLSLRYGENPHQPAALYRPRKGRLTVGGLRELKGGKGGLSRTNVEDVNNALSTLKYFDDPACAVMKHLNPSGVAAPSFEEEAMAVFSRKRGLRVLQVENLEGLSRFVGDDPGPSTLSTLMDGSIIVSTPLLTKVRGPEDLRMVTERKPTPREAADLVFSWHVCMNVRSNGVVISKDGATLGIGTGQQDRVTAVKLALEKAVARGHGDELRGAVLASDGFFPFPDSVELMGEHGVSACVQPGGSIRDRKVIEACDSHGIAMAFTDERCFRHF